MIHLVATIIAIFGGFLLVKTSFDGDFKTLSEGHTRIEKVVRANHDSLQRLDGKADWVVFGSQIDESEAHLFEATSYQRALTSWTENGNAIQDIKIWVAAAKKAVSVPSSSNEISGGESNAAMVHGAQVTVTKDEIQLGQAENCYLIWSKYTLSERVVARALSRADVLPDHGTKPSQIETARSLTRRIAIKKKGFSDGFENWLNGFTTIPYRIPYRIMNNLETVDPELADDWAEFVRRVYRMK